MDLCCEKPWRSRTEIAAASGTPMENAHMRKLTLIACASLVLVSQSAFAITTAQRIAYLKYYACLSNPFQFDKTLCHL